MAIHDWPHDRRLAERNHLVGPYELVSLLVIQHSASDDWKWYGGAVSCLCRTCNLEQRLALHAPTIGRLRTTYASLDCWQAMRFVWQVGLMPVYRRIRWDFSTDFFKADRRSDPCVGTVLVHVTCNTRMVPNRHQTAGARWVLLDCRAVGSTSLHDNIR